LAGSFVAVWVGCGSVFPSLFAAFLPIASSVQKIFFGAPLEVFAVACVVAAPLPAVVVVAGVVQVVASVAPVLLACELYARVSVYVRNAVVGDEAGEGVGASAAFVLIEDVGFVCGGALVLVLAAVVASSTLLGVCAILASGSVA
jgi:hypothetical protein